jgi:hypothetical protein
MSRTFVITALVAAFFPAALAAAQQATPPATTDGTPRAENVGRAEGVDAADAAASSRLEYVPFENVETLLYVNSEPAG